MPVPKNEFTRLHTRITEIRRYASQLDPGDPVTSELAKYLCVLTSGLVEAKLRDVISRLVSNSRPSQTIGNAANAFAQTIQNPKFDRLKSIVKVISPAVESRLNAMGAETSAALNSIMANRHLISHGRDAQLSLKRIESYIDNLDPLFAELDRIR